MQVSPESIAEFQRLYEAHFSVSLSENEAMAEASSLISLVEVVFLLDQPSAAMPGYGKKEPSDGDRPITY